MPNSLTQTQIYTVLNSIAKQATGNSALVATDTSSFVTVGQEALLTGYDNVISAIFQVLSKTIFSIRPYERKFGRLEQDAIRFGNHVRKLNIIDKDWEQDDRLPLTDGQAVDQWVINKPEILQLNFYGQNVFQRHYTLFKDQLDVAFSSEAEFSRFITMVTSNCNDMIEQAHESLARMTVVNAIAGIIALNNPNQIVHLLTEYNTLTGLSLTAQTVYQPDNYKAFVQWAYALMASVCEMLTERSQIYHNNIAGKEISRHTPKSMQSAYIYAPNKYMMDAMVISNTFNEQYLPKVNAELVNYFQSIESPNEIDVTCSYMDATGAKATAAVQESNVFSLICDDEMMGYTPVNQWSKATDLNARGGYSNVFYHFTDRYYVDNSENAVLFLLD